MKAFPEVRYEYIGVKKFEGQTYHAFREVQHGGDEIVLVKQAALVKNDGTRIYYDPIK